MSEQQSITPPISDAAERVLLLLCLYKGPETLRAMELTFTEAAAAALDLSAADVIAAIAELRRSGMVHTRFETN